MKYHIKYKEIDQGTDYPLLILSGLTGLGQETIRELSDKGEFSMKDHDGQPVINGGEFLSWSSSVNHVVDVHKG